MREDRLAGREAEQRVPSAKDVALRAGLGGTFSYFKLGSPMRHESLLDGSNLPDKDWAEFVPAMRNRVMRFEIVDEDEWEQRLNAMLAT